MKEDKKIAKRYNSRFMLRNSSTVVIVFPSMSVPMWFENKQLRGRLKTKGKTKNPIVLGGLKLSSSSIINQSMKCSLFTAHYSRQTVHLIFIPLTPFMVKDWHEKSYSRDMETIS